MNQGANTVTKVEIKVEAPAGTTNAKTKIPEGAVKQAVDDGIDYVIISNPVANITFDSDALSTISEAKGDVTISTDKVVSSTLSSEIQDAVGDRPVYNFSVTSGGTEISQFGGNVTVSIPYTPKAGENLNSIIIYYINAEGKLEIVKNCNFNPITGMVSFNTNHFSRYAVGYNMVSFRDVPTNAWYSTAISFIGAREITTGTGTGNFSPGAKLTRGDFMVLLMRAYGIAPDKNPSDNFSDAENNYQTGYLAAAKRLGLSNGVGNNFFAPARAITRQEMFTLLYNTLKMICQLPKATIEKPLSEFTDSDKIASWAEEAIACLVNAGVISGSGSKLSPVNITTRAEMAQMLYNLLSME
jgi:hypothetical protein